MRRPGETHFYRAKWREKERKGKRESKTKKGEKKERSSRGNNTAAREGSGGRMYIFWRDYCRFSAAVRTILASPTNGVPDHPLPLKLCVLHPLRTAAGAKRSHVEQRGIEKLFSEGINGPRGVLSRGLT